MARCHFYQYDADKEDEEYVGTAQPADGLNKTWGKIQDVCSRKGLEMIVCEVWPADRIEHVISIGTVFRSDALDQ